MVMKKSKNGSSNKQETSNKDDFQIPKAGLPGKYMKL